jgi:hypothetical protein
MLLLMDTDDALIRVEDRWPAIEHLVEELPQGR